MADAKSANKNHLLEVREALDKVAGHVDSMQGTIDKAFAPIVETVERHEATLTEHDELLKHMDRRIEIQTAAMEQMRLEVLEFHGAQSAAAETVKEVQCEMAMPLEALPPPMPRVGGGWDRLVEPHVLQAKASSMFGAAALVAPITPLVEAANISLDDVEVRMPPGVAVAKRWTLEIKGRDPRTAARRVAMLLGALRDGSGWRCVKVESAAGERCRFTSRWRKLSAWCGPRWRASGTSESCALASLGLLGGCCATKALAARATSRSCASWPPRATTSRCSSTPQRPRTSS